MPGIALRPYQRDTVQAIRAAIQGGCRRPLAVLPTGAGKTIVFGAYAQAEAAAAGGRTLILAHREELLDQAAAKLGLVWPAAEVGVVQGARDGYQARDVVLASIGTLLHRERRARLGQVDRIVCDEAHHAVSVTWRTVLDDLGAFAPHGPPCIGVTATPARADQRGLGAVFQRIVYERSMLWMVLRGYLCDLRTLVVRTDTALDGVRLAKDGDFDPGPLGSVLNTANRNELIVRTYAERSPDRKALAFTATVRHAEDLAAAFLAAGVSAAAVSGRSSAADRHRAITDFRAARLRVLCNAAVLTEGYDDAGIAAILLARPTRSAALYAQMVGRGLRPHPRKADCLLVDFADASRRHNLIGLPSLWPAGEQRDAGAEAALPGTGESLVEAMGAWGQTGALGLELPVGGDVRIQDIGSLLARSQFNWRALGDDLVLDLHGGRRIELRRQPAEGELYEVGLVEERQWLPLADRPLDVGFSQGVAEDYVRDHGLSWVRKDAPWRDRAVTDKQREVLQQHGLPVPATRGEAEERISALVWRRAR